MKNLIIALLLTLIACKKDEAATPLATLATKVDLGFDTELVYQEGVKIKITKVEDSRCPQNVVCVWAGMARIFFTISEKDISKDLSIDFESKPIKTTVDLGGQKYEIEILDVLPYPKNNVEIKQKDYKVSLIVKKV
jgi:hypothetical protein